MSLTDIYLQIRDHIATGATVGTVGVALIQAAMKKQAATRIVI